ncbi:5'-nucleotidase [Cellulomonas chitinilytica]|uniref:5'-nucleotidase n=1 Tax=Cellulomonas chitinilytica TaxID=398759 RepID=A0A919U2T9_9CELL|nr:HAD hydrolase-like protein [Cellulomonas chitinilytica]GIG21802.1 5'-nucleotidase [Cellulomonas chitinilytica]
MTPPLVLLDLDGTLIDSGPTITASVAAAYDELGLPVPAPALLRSFVGPPLADVFRAHGVPPARVADAVAAYRRVYVGGAMLGATVFDGIPDALAGLRHAGLRLVVATAKPEAYASTLCDHLGLSPLLDGLAGASLDGTRSSKAAVVRRALDGHGGVPRRTLMVGDREHDVHGARAHGIDCLGVAWGYAAPGELTAAGAVGLVDQPADLAAEVLASLERLAA